MIRRALLLALLACACTSRASAPSESASASPSPPAPAPAPQAASALPSASPSTSASPSPSRSARLSFDEALATIHTDPATASARAATCTGGDETARVRCLLADRFSADAKAVPLAEELYTRFGTAAGVEAAHTMDGGYRGMIRIEPALPVGAERKHLEWVVSAMRDYESFFSWLAVSPDARPYRFRALSFRFMRSVAKRTPTAYAHDWTIAYNLSGSLLVSEDAARETLFHEIFHLNDSARKYWSGRALKGLYDEIVDKCGTNAACLAPYAPTETMVKGGTYYAFVPQNGVVEYAAELALRYYREQRNVMRGTSKGRSFKCGPPQNERAWVQLRDEFFGGVDKVAACR